MMKLTINCAFIYALSFFATTCWTSEAFTPPSIKTNLLIAQQSNASFSSTKVSVQGDDYDNESEISRRRALVNGAISAFGLASAFEARADVDDKTRGGVPLTPMNGLTFNYRGNDFGGLDASTLNEPSITYSDFLKKLDAGEVEFVEFFAPDGDVAYATLKPKEGEEKMKPIRIGEGYPIEQHDGWSSPAFAVKSVAKKNVPYKFVVPGLTANYAKGDKI